MHRNEEMRVLIKAIDKTIDFFETTVCSIGFIAMCVIVFLQIILRTIGFPLAWTEEIARYLFVWIIYLAASKAVKLDRHLVVGFLPLAFKGRAQQAVYLLGNIITFVIILIICFNCFLVLRRMGVRPQTAPASGINMIIPYMAPAIGSAMMTIRCIQNCITNVRHIIMPPSLEGAGK